jgi:hypothetical protein
VEKGRIAGVRRDGRPLAKLLPLTREKRVRGEGREEGVGEMVVFGATRLGGPGAELQRYQNRAPYGQDLANLNLDTRVLSDERPGEPSFKTRVESLENSFYYATPEENEAMLAELRSD